ncbi:hypothetical protein BIY24_16155 [Halobacteriovorax marinus]|uniref:hypothetical protein n=1 Tax=Halobacteriovorax marinus TaxID=97084 RepID=UPI000BC32C25|nr:hypothetical protein [Halobacteriovorax marinus]ATH09417.1 hypothetical protein BIY24_16155 [Halobacteriovorax marinus]
MTEEKKAPEEEKKKPESVLNAYRDRLKSLKQARQYYSTGEIPKAVEKYSQYLNTLASYFGVSEERLSPNFFDNEKEISELLLISQVYWDLAKAYDRSPNLHRESIRCLDQFVKFTNGFKYQHINAQMLRKFIKRKQAHNLKAFQNAYTKIQVDSKGCFIASYSYGANHQVTNDLREFKKILLELPLGFKFVELYYRLSPHIVSLFEGSGSIGKLINYIALRPLLFLISLIGKKK